MKRRALSWLMGAALVLALCACGGNSEKLSAGSTVEAASEDVSGASDAGAPAAETASETADGGTADQVDVSGGEADTAASEGQSKVYADMGLTLNYPAEFVNCKGCFQPYSYGEVSRGINLMQFNYLAMTEEEYWELIGKESLTEEDNKFLQTRLGALQTVVTINKGRGKKEIIEKLEASEDLLERLVEFGKVQDVTFYRIDADRDLDAYAADVGEEYAQEYKKLHDSLIEVLTKAELSVPVVEGSEYIGRKISFETTDVNGTSVKSEDIFAQNKVTMINVWATWCGPCKSELKALGDMHRRYAEKKAAVVGLCVDADESAEECRNLIAENGIDYLNLLPFEGYEGVIPIPCYPVSYFVDSEGTILAPPVKGAPNDIRTYEEILDELLEAE